MVRKLQFLVAILAVSAFAACGGDDGGSGGGGGGEDTGGGGEDATSDMGGGGTDTGGEDTGGEDTGGEDTGGEDTVDPPPPVECETSCETDADCDSGQACLGGGCAEAATAAEYEFSDTFSYVWRIQIPPRSANCCFDYNGDGSIDNALGLLAPFAASQGLDIDTAIGDALAEGSVTLLLEYNDIPEDFDGAVDASLFLGEADTDDDGAPDQTIEERIAGNGVFQILPDSFGDFGSQIQFNCSGLTPTDDGALMTTNESQFLLSLPTADLIGEDLQLTIDRARIEASVRSEEEGWFSNDEEITVDGETMEFGGAKLGGVIQLGQILEVVNDLSRDCTCAGIEETDTLVLFGENEESGRYEISCNEEVDLSTAGECTADDGVICENIGTVCDVIPLLGNLGLTDVDIDGSGINDSVSVGIRLSLSGAALADPAIAE